jgi:hypothetical protein
MRSSKCFEPTRLEVLTLLIGDMFLNISPDTIARSTLQYDESITEMFQIEKTGPSSKQLRHVFNDDIFEPVIFPPEIRPLLKKRDIFLMTLGRKDETWHVLWMSTAYD